MVLHALPPLPLVACQGRKVCPQLLRVRSWSSFACCLPRMTQPRLHMLLFRAGRPMERFASVFGSFEAYAACLLSNRVSSNRGSCAESFSGRDARCLLLSAVCRCAPRSKGNDYNSCMLDCALLDTLGRAFKRRAKLGAFGFATWDKFRFDAPVLMLQCNGCVVALLHSFKFTAKRDESSRDPNESIDPASSGCDTCVSRKRGRCAS